MTALLGVASPDSEPVELSVRIDTSCTACGNCLVTCPTRALTRAPGRPAVSDQRCIGCWECIEVCPVDAITELRKLVASR